jgi:hypothetical protein
MEMMEDEAGRWLCFYRMPRVARSIQREARVFQNGFLNRQYGTSLTY